MVGVKSSGMLMAASDAAHENVELLVPPEGSLPGERIWFGSEDEKENLPEAASPNQVLILCAFTVSYLCLTKIDSSFYFFATCVMRLER